MPARSSQLPNRLGGLRRFAIAITILNILGHTVLGFEQSYAQPLVAMVAAYSTEIFLEWIGSRTSGHRPAYSGSLRVKIDFLLSAHISALAVAMLLYSNQRLWPTAFAASRYSPPHKGKEKLMQITRSGIETQKGPAD